MPSSPETARIWRDAHREQLKAYRHMYYLAHREELLAKGKIRGQAWYQAHRSEISAKSRSRNIQLRIEVFEAYGGTRCVCCGEAYIEFLTLDHAAGDGAEHRREVMLSGKRQSNFYMWLKKQGYPSGIRVLCWNCNCSLAHNGYCPHGNVQVETKQYSLRDGNGLHPAQLELFRRETNV